MFISGGCFREVKKEMERTYKLDLQSINDAKDFVVAINKLNSEVDARYGVRVVDAKSMFGLLNMSHCKPLKQLFILMMKMRLMNLLKFVRDMR